MNVNDIVLCVCVCVFVYIYIAWLKLLNSSIVGDMALKKLVPIG